MILFHSHSFYLDTCAVDGRMFASGFSVVSKNALLCGGSNEIAFDGKNVLHVPSYLFMTNV